MIKPIHDVEAIATFIHTHNIQLNYHIGFVGTDLAEIKDTLLTDFSDFPLSQSVIGAYEGEELVALIAFDVDKEDASADVWGPFVKNDDPGELASTLWKAWMELAPIPIDSYSFFPNIHNKDVIEFTKDLGATINGEYFVLTNERIHHQPLALPKTLVPFHEEDVEAFTVLHEEHFPNTYLSVKDILSSIDDYHKLFIYKEHGLAKGYVYVEANPTFGDSDIHFVAVNSAFRGQGIGTSLLNVATTFLFSFSTIENISLCVSSTSEEALAIYNKAHFKKTYSLISSTLQNKET